LRNRASSTLCPDIFYRTMRVKPGSATPREAPQTRDDPLPWWRRVSHDPFRMVGPRIFPKLGNRDENPAANAPCWQTPNRVQVVNAIWLIESICAASSRLARILLSTATLILAGGFFCSPLVDLISDAPDCQPFARCNAKGWRICVHLRSATALTSLNACPRPFTGSRRRS
jgi:hypothetical protein